MKQQLSYYKQYHYIYNLYHNLKTEMWVELNEQLAVHMTKQQQVKMMTSLTNTEMQESDESLFEE